MEAARKLQIERQAQPNALLGTKDIDRYCETDREGDQLRCKPRQPVRLVARPSIFHSNVLAVDEALLPQTACEHR